MSHGDGGDLMHIYGLRERLRRDSDLMSSHWNEGGIYELHFRITGCNNTQSLDMIGTWWDVLAERLPVLSHHIQKKNKTKQNNTKWCIYLFRRCEANRLIHWLSGVCLCSCNNVNKILWTRVINILFNLENAVLSGSSSSSLQWLNDSCRCSNPLINTYGRYAENKGLLLGNPRRCHISGY